jgi:hypothetical protein
MDNQPSRFDRTRSKAAIAMRLRLIRSEIFGDHGGPELADQLGLPFRTWFNYETGVTIPGEVLLQFLAVTGTEPLWLLSHEGPRYRATTPDSLANPRVQT